MPELPDATRDRLLGLGLSQRDADVLMSVDSGRDVRYDGELARGAVGYFDAVARGRDPKVVVNWWARTARSAVSCTHTTPQDHS